MIQVLKTLSCALFVSAFVCSTASGAGRQLTGVYAPTPTPALPPEEAQKKFTVPEGFEVRLFAAEPQVINPVAMTWDERGRLWVVELYEYPLGAPEGTKPRDNVKILEDTDNDGRADKVTVFADGLNLATGVLVGYGGVFVGQAPHLIFMEDTDGDDKADKQTIVKTGFGLEDRHELLNGFTWGPDGYLYMTHGVFTHSKVKNPDDPNDDGVTMTAAVARFHPRTKEFEVFAEGTSNPWGVDFDAAGNAFVSACVIDHLFHMSPGGLYVRQAGNPPYPYAYDLLPSIVDHKHFRAAYSGIQVYQGNQYPEEYQGTILMGNIHDSAVHQDRLTSDGASFKASFVRDFVRANDGWFRPVSIQVGPDGAAWIMDWYDKYPCYQNANADPEGVDRTHGRIWRVVYTGDEKGKAMPSRPETDMNLGKLTSDKLAGLLKHPNAWHRRTAQRILSERGDTAFDRRSFHPVTPVHEILKSGETVDARLAALWTLHGMGILDEQALDTAAEDKAPAVRAWAARLTGERGLPVEEAMSRLSKLAKDPEITVRTGVAVAARQFVSSSLTINTPPQVPLREVVTGGVMSDLWFSTKGVDDPLFTFTYWMAVEPLIAFDPIHAVGFYGEDGAIGQMPFSGKILTRIMRRISDMNDAAILSSAILELKNLQEAHAPALVAALKGIVEGQRGRPLLPNSEARAVVSRWAKFTDQGVASLAQQLGSQWGESAAIETALKTILDDSRGAGERIKMIESVRQQKSPQIRQTLLKVIGSNAPESVIDGALQALSEVGGDETGKQILKHWEKLTPGSRRIAAGVLSSRTPWAIPFLDAVESKVVSGADIPVPVVRTLTTSRDEAIRKRAADVIGRFRETDADKAKLIAEKKQVVLNGPVDLRKGREIAQKTCFTCHKLHGEGADVGPDLTGVGRSSIEALLANIIDPNQIIGIGYENVEVETKDGRSISGRLVEETETRMKLVSAGPKEEIISKSDIESTRVSQMSVMPEGLEQMPDEDFRNMIWYLFNPPQDQKPMQVEIQDKKLIVRSATPGTDQLQDLVTYVTDPALRPYLHPVKDPSGKTALTQDRPDDHPWQHGIFTGLHKVNGVDFWSEKEGKQRFVRLLDISQEQDHVGWRSLTEWVAPDGTVVLEEIQDVKVYAPLNPSSYNIDFGWTLQARDQAVRIGKHEYGGFSVRMDYSPKHSHLNSEGDRDKAAAEKRAAWCNVSRQFGNDTFGLAVLDHPTNPGFPARWRVDGQGLINPSPSLQGDWTIDPNQEKTFHYRVVVHTGPGNEQQLKSAFDQFASIRFDTLAANVVDGESVALWNPEWSIDAPHFEESVQKLPTFAGKRNVLITHPYDQEKPATIARVIDVPAGRQTLLALNVAAHEKGDWQLRIFAGDKKIKEQVITHDGDRWKTVTVDLSQFAGKRVPVRLENKANDWNWEFGYWHDIRIQSSDKPAAAN